MAHLSPFRGASERAQFIAAYEGMLQRWPLPYDERDVSTSFGQTHVIITGSPKAAPLVLLHGATATAAMWQPIIGELARVHRYYAIDTVGDANKIVATRTFRGAVDYVDWLQQVFSCLSINVARLAGLSYGGWLAALLALHAPARVSHLTLLCPAETLLPMNPWIFLRVVPATFLRSPFLMQRSLGWMSSRPDASSLPLMKFLVTALATCRTIRLETPLTTVLTDEELRRIAAPTTVLIGDQDVTYRGGPKAALLRALKHIPNVRTHLMPHSNHLLPLDCQELLAMRMLEAYSSEEK